MIVNKYDALERKLESMVLQQLDLTRDVTNDEIYSIIDRCMQMIEELVNEDQTISLRDKLRIRQDVFYSMRGLDVLTPLLEDETVTEVMVNGYDNIFYEKDGVIQKSTLQFRDQQKYHDIIQHIVAGSNRTVNEANPIVDSRLEDGSRVNVVLSPISLDGSAMTIRKFPKDPISMDRLIALGSLNENVAELLELFVKSGYNILISGGTGSGKTTFLNALSNFIDKSERIITIEDSAELQLQDVSNLVRLEVRNANVEGKFAITMNDLIRSSLRMRPDRIIVGEVRGEEALAMLQALNTGHDGSISTGHANSAKDMLARLETMVLMGFEMPVYALRGQIASALEIIIHLGRLRDHSRRVMEIVEVLGLKDGEIECQKLFEFQEDRRMEGKDQIQIELSNDSYRHMRVQGQMVQKHKLKQINKLMEAGYYEKYCELLKIRKEDSKK